MKITYSWLKELTGINESAEEIGKRLTLTGLENHVKAQGKDFLYEIEVTSNRPDCLSAIGLAREVCAAFGKKLGAHPRLPGKSPAKPAVDPAIEIDKNTCPVYTARIIKGVTIAPSSCDIAGRLESIGSRPVNNVVDMTNYVMFETGQPLHAFDLDKLKSVAGIGQTGKLVICVRRAVAGEQIITIDGEKRQLNTANLVIAAGESKNKTVPVAVAGVMGGMDTEVGAQTKNILLEAAVFNPLVIRQSRQSLGLQSESAYRFERGVDLGMVERSAALAQALIIESAGGTFAGESGVWQAQPADRRIKLAPARIKSVLGIDIQQELISRILNALEIETSILPDGNMEAAVPSFRPDINVEVDLFEEVARIYGYDKVSAALPAVTPQNPAQDVYDRVRRVRRIMTGLGVNEVITYSLVDPAVLGKFQPLYKGEPIKVSNPLSREQALLRTSLLPGLLSAVALNLNQKQDFIGIFEIANTYRMENAPRQELFLGTAFCGSRDVWLESGKAKEKASFLHVKGCLEALLERLGIKGYNLRPVADGAYIVAGDSVLGFLGRVNKDTLEAFSIKNQDVFAGEVSLEKLLALCPQTICYNPLPVYPGISRDLSLVVPENADLGKMMEAVHKSGGGLLTQAKIIDYYRGNQIARGFISITISLLFRSAQKTLTENEVSEPLEKISKTLAENFSARLR